MQIEKFDTGLKGQESVKKLIITPKENYNNKLIVRRYLNSIINEGISKLDDNLDKSFSKEIKVNCFHPLNEFSGLNDFKQKILDTFV